MSSVLAAGAPARPWRELWLITVGHGLTHWYPATFYLLLPLIGAELGLSYSQIGLIMTCQYIASAVANVPGGVLVDTVGRKGLLMAVSLFWVGFSRSLSRIGRRGATRCCPSEPRWWDGPGDR